MKEKIKSLLSNVEQLYKDGEQLKSASLPSGCYFLNEDEILAEKRYFGDSRYPYSSDGLTLWAYSSGNLKIEESTFNIILPFPEGKEPNLAFYIGKKKGDGYFPVSVTGAGKLPFEENINRFTVFTPKAVYYFVKTEAITACLRAFVDTEKNITFTLGMENNSDEAVETYMAAYMNPMLSHSPCENIETKWYKKCCQTDGGFNFFVTEYLDRTKCFNHFAQLRRENIRLNVTSTTSHTDFCGGMNNQLCCSQSLIQGQFKSCNNYTEFTDTAIAGDIIPLKLNGGEYAEISYTLSVNHSAPENISTAAIDNQLYGKSDIIGGDIPAVKIQGDWLNVKAEKLENFLKSVHRQTEFCARAKNYAGPYIGIRDIFQQLEAALLWIPSYSRTKIIEAFNFLGEDGRAPRQYSYPAEKGAVPPMDLRPYVDQGVWMISTLYTYLAFTGDYSILNEECGYYRFETNTVLPSGEKDTVLEHLLRIVEFLESNLDDETCCLHALYGDWNDALDGLGKTEDKDKEFGSGVSVMASLQFYRNLGEMCEILKRVGDLERVKKYSEVREKLKDGLIKYAVVTNREGERKIVHGWGDKREYLVGSFNDNDGESRDGLTSNAFWVLCGAYKWDESIKKDISAAYDRLDSKYGLKTFEPYFAPDNVKVGRITRLPKGTAENGAVYIHATLFAIQSLFEMGEAEKAWRQIYKILPITHKFISTTPFVMPNSYVENEEKGFDGESMSDWFAGSGCVLLKTIYFNVFGLKADFDGLTIAPCSYLPFEQIKTSLNIKGTTLNITLKKGCGKRKFVVNGKEIYADKIRLENSELKNELTIAAEL